MKLLKNIDKDKKNMIFGLIAVIFFGISFTYYKDLKGNSSEKELDPVMSVELQKDTVQSKEKLDRIKNNEINPNNTTTTDRVFFKTNYGNDSVKQYQPNITVEKEQQNVPNFKSPNLSSIINNEEPQNSNQSDLYRGVNMVIPNTNKSKDNTLNNQERYDVKDNEVITKEKTEDDGYWSAEDEEKYPAVTWNANDDPDYQKSSGKTTKTLIKSSIQGTSLKKNRVTPENPRVRILPREDFWINGYEIKEFTTLIAYATFGRELGLKITSIPITLKNGKKDILECDIDVIDGAGQPALEVIGGAYQDVKDGVASDIGNEISSNSEIQKVPGSSSVVKGLFKKKKRIIVNNHSVYLKINEVK